MWKNTDNVLDWFNIADNTNARLIKFDIVDFYPSISEELLNKALAFAKTHVAISDDDLQVINHTKSSLLFDGQSTWKKKSGVFDVTMGSYDDAECCEIVGIYLLNKLSTIMRPEEHGMYRYDGLGLIPNANGPKQDRLRKDIARLFK